MTRRERLKLSFLHYLGLSPRCPHPPHRIFDLDNGRFRCLECWLSWRSDSRDEEEAFWDMW